MVASSLGHQAPGAIRRLDSLRAPLPVGPNEVDPRTEEPVVVQREDNRNSRVPGSVDHTGGQEIRALTVKDVGARPIEVADEPIADRVVLVAKPEMLAGTGQLQTQAMDHHAVLVVALDRHVFRRIDAFDAHDLRLVSVRDEPAGYSLRV